MLTRTPLVFALLLFASAIPLRHAEAQAEAAPADALEEVAVDPIRCWWRTDRSAVHVGERFLLTLTCRVVETETVTVMPTVTQLDPGAVLLTPFEAVDGRRHEDVVEPPYRYLQYEYVVRFLGEGAFGTDVQIPALTVTYAIQAAAGDAAAQGREQRYVLPAIPMRVVSLAPGTASDIRDASTDTFAGMQTRRFRARAAFVTSGLLFGLSVVLVGVAGLRAFAGRQKTKTAARPVREAVVMQGCLRALRDVKAEAAREGWSPGRARRAAAAFRVAGAAAMGRPIAQQPANGRAEAPEGQIVVHGGIVHRRRVFVSAPTTPDALARHLANGNGGPERLREAARPIHSALETFSLHAYGRNGSTSDGADLDAALESGSAAIRRLQMYGLWKIPGMTAASDSAES